MTKKRNTADVMTTTGIILIATGTVAAVGSIVAYNLDKRDKKKQTEARLRHNVEYAKFMETAEAVIEYLDRSIEKARKVLDDDTFEQIIEDF
jgi:hypothetical protein